MFLTARGDGVARPHGGEAAFAKHPEGGGMASFRIAAA